jgi:hypothetical protein
VLCSMNKYFNDGYAKSAKKGAPLKSKGTSDPGKGPVPNPAIRRLAGGSSWGSRWRIQASTFAINFIDDGSRIAKRLEVLQRVAVIDPGVAAFNLLDEFAECIE